MTRTRPSGSSARSRTLTRGAIAGLILPLVALTAVAVVVVSRLASGRGSTAACDAAQTLIDEQRESPAADAVTPLPVSQGAIQVTGAFARPTQQGGELIFSITNGSSTADRLRCVVTDATDSARIHADSQCSNSSSEVTEQSSLDIPPTTVVVLKPGGCVIALEGPATMLDARDLLRVVLQFESGLLGMTVAVKGSSSSVTTTGAGAADYTLDTLCAALRSARSGDLSPARQGFDPHGTLHDLATAVVPVDRAVAGRLFRAMDEAGRVLAAPDTQPGEAVTVLEELSAAASGALVTVALGDVETCEEG